jgi:putative tricarboxylic transport membrane protein
VFDPLLTAAGRLAEFSNLLLVLLGTGFGLAIGILPGLSILTAMALALPFTFGMDPMSAMFLLAGVMGAAPFGGSTTAILFNIPGEPFNAATCFDGYPMAKKGEAARALGVSAMSSALGGVFGLLVLLALIPAVRQIIFAFGPPEFFMLILFGLVTVAFAAPGNMVRGLVCAGLGVLLSLVGFSSATGDLRFTLGSRNYLWDGISLSPFFLGIFAIKEVVEYYTQGGSIAPTGEKIRAGLKGTLAGAIESFRYWREFILGSLVGVVVGILPGVGGTVSNFLSYTLAMRGSRHPERFGTGVPEAIVAVESSNNSKDGGDLLPTVAFGIPGSSTMALLMGAFILHGFNPGPLFLRAHMDIVWGLILGRLLSSLLASTAGLLAAGLMARLTFLNVIYLVPTIFGLSLLGAYTERENIWDVLLAIAAGLFAYGLVRFKFPIVTLVIGFVLGQMAEQALLQSLQMSFGDYSIFFTRPIALILFFLMILTLLFPFFKRAPKEAIP